MSSGQPRHDAGGVVVLPSPDDRPYPSPSQKLLTRHKTTALLGASLVAMLLALVCLRSWVFVWFPHSHMDSDQAVFGLMAKDIALGRGYPLFMYGQKYMLAVGSWLCAPLFALFGVSVTTLKFPMFAMNLACVVMLWFGLRRERELGVWGATLSTLPFAMTSAITASRLVEHQGGNIEPIFFLLCAFMLRERPLLLGIIFGIAFLNREFTPIGFIAMLMMDALQGRLKARLRAHGLTLLAAAIVVIVIRQIAATQPGYYGSGAHGSLQPFWNGEGLSALFLQHLPRLFNATRTELHEAVVSRLHGGYDFLAYVAIGWAVLGVVGACKQQRSDFDGIATYLVLIGLAQSAAFVLLCASPSDAMYLRYVLVSLCILPGLTAYAWRARGLRPWIGAVVVVFAIANTRDHVRLVREYVQKPPRHENEKLAKLLKKRGVRFAEADYWVAYDVTWLTDERIIVAPFGDQANRIARYRELLDQHRDEVFSIRDAPCKNGEPLLRWHLCK